MLTQRLALQIATGVSATLPIVLGLNGMFRGPAVLAKAFAYPAVVDSHFRYLSGLPVGMGILLLRSLPNIDQDGSDLRRVSLLVFIGGLGRLWGLITVGYDPRTMMITLSELLVFPLIYAWQNRLQRNNTRSHMR